MSVDAAKTTIVDLRHPDYNDLQADWTLWRETYRGGRHFIQTYLKMFSSRETQAEFKARKELTPCPAFASSALDKIKNHIYGRMNDITRAGGPASYIEACKGTQNGVDLSGSSMNHFVGERIMPELLSMRKVGVYVDMPAIHPGMTQLDVLTKNPYLYMYHAEEILNWTVDLSVNPFEFKQLLLKEQYVQYDAEFGFPNGVATRFRYMYINDDGFVNVQYYNTDAMPITAYGSASFQPYTLSINRIPFVVFELPYSLLRDVARYQVALLNMESSDIGYCLKANFPFYTEQVSPIPSNMNDKGAGKDVAVGTQTGRAYAQGLDRPGFINPSADPLRVSIEKQEQMKSSILQLVHLAVTNLAPAKQQSAESKGMDNQGLEAGLAFIGMELERGERRISEFWAMYLNDDPTTINYPTQYSVKSDAECVDEALNDAKLLPTVPSLTFQKEMAKKIARNILGRRVSKEVLLKIEKEIDAATVIPPDRKSLQMDVELGIIDRANAAKACCYPDDAAQLANQEHADRLTRIALSQANSAGINKNVSGGAPDARGVNDLGTDPGAGGREEKRQSRQTDNNSENTIPTRGQNVG